MTRTRLAIAPLTHELGAWPGAALVVCLASHVAEPVNLGLNTLRRIQKDVAWLDDIGGITDAMIRNISLVRSSRLDSCGVCSGVWSLENLEGRQDQN